MERKGKILVVDDEAQLRYLLSKELSRAGYTIDVAEDAASATVRVREDFYHVVLLDLVMPGMDGISWLRSLRSENIISEVIILTGNATIESAIESMKLGAFEYIRKPYDINELIIHIDRAIEHQRSQLDRILLKEELKKAGLGGKLVGASKEINDLRLLIGRIAKSPSTVLILGESGTGKELVARAIHEESARRSKQFVAVSCAALPPNLLESELFGYEKGAFTDAKSQKRGLAEAADGGILFLDEIGELPLPFQSKLLRFLETGAIRRVGGTKDIELDVRILCATNRPLEALVEKNEFRADLYYRLNVFTINVPPLRQHKEDIPGLIENIINRLGFQKKFNAAVLDMLGIYDWPGNVRELKNVIERACILSSNETVDEKDISFLKIKSKPEVPDSAPKESANGPQVAIPSLRDVERGHIIEALKRMNGHKGKAAKALGITPKTLSRKMKEYAIAQVYE
jgi:two-component system, NtrC family, response regulator AtoC